MKRWILLLGIILSGTVLQAQNLGTVDLIEICDNSLGEVEEFLGERNWYFIAAEDEDEGVFANARFVFDRPDFKPTTSASYFMTYYHSELNKAQAVQIAFKVSETYENFMNQLKALKFKLVSSKPLDGNIRKVYKKGWQYVEVNIPSNFKGANTYKMLFAKKSSYKKIRGI